MLSLSWVLTSKIGNSTSLAASASGAVWTLTPSGSRTITALGYFLHCTEILAGDRTFLIQTAAQAMDTNRTIGRLAPSPTGAQHVGNARTYLLAWLSVRTRGGLLRLRSEDIDSPRIKKNAVEQIYEDLTWLGLDWDGTPLIQSARLGYYHQALQKLQQLELVYPCTCTRSDVERAASAPHAEHEGISYPGTCAGNSVADAARLKRPYCWRFRMPRQDTFTFTDGVHGEVQLTAAALGGDFVVWKSDGTPAYQLAVVVDDAAQGITEVLRGADLIPSTPRQILLYQALGWPPPHFVHVPLVVGPDGRRLAKRHGDTRLSALRQGGVRSEALLGLLAWSCGWLERLQPLRVAELVPLFRLDTLPRQPFVLEPDLLARLGYQP